MLYKFKSKATADLIMLEPSGRRVLQVIGKSADAKGILEVVDMDAALSALRAAIEQEEQELAEARRLAEAEGSVAPAAPEVSLRQRAAPFIQMLQRAQAEDVPVVWGV